MVVAVQATLRESDETPAESEVLRARGPRRFAQFILEGHDNLMLPQEVQLSYI